MDFRIAAIFLIAFLIANLVLFAFGKINEILFWAVIIAIAIIAYRILPKFKKNRV